MAGYKIFIQVKSMRFGLSIEDLHEIVQINLGPNVGDITIRYDPPRRGRVIPMSTLEAQDQASTWNFN